MPRSDNVVRRYSVTLRSSAKRRREDAAEVCSRALTYASFDDFAGDVWWRLGAELGATESEGCSRIFDDAVITIEQCGRNVKITISDITFWTRLDGQSSATLSLPWPTLRSIEVADQVLALVRRASARPVLRAVPSACD